MTDGPVGALQCLFATSFVGFRPKRFVGGGTPVRESSAVSVTGLVRVLLVRVSFTGPVPTHAQSAFNARLVFISATFLQTRTVDVAGRTAQRLHVRGEFSIRQLWKIPVGRDEIARSRTRSAAPMFAIDKYSTAQSAAISQPIGIGHRFPGRRHQDGKAAILEPQLIQRQSHPRIGLGAHHGHGTGQRRSSLHLRNFRRLSRSVILV